MPTRSIKGIRVTGERSPVESGPSPFPLLVLVLMIMAILALKLRAEEPIGALVKRTVLPEYVQ